VALFQLISNRSNSYTVVDQAVSASNMVNRRHTAFTNGVLRNFLRKKIKIFKEIEKNEEAKYSYQAWWINQIKKEYPKSWKDILDIGNSHPALIIRINLKKISINGYIRKIEEKNIEHIVLGNEAILIKNPIPLDSLPGFYEGEVSIQDYGAQLASHLLDLKKNYSVLDACAAPGGKACHMTEIEEIKLTAVEVDKQRVQKIIENLNRLGHSFKVINAEIKTGNSWWDKKLFDRILLDAPCTASGIVRRHIDIKWLRRANDLNYFHEKQFELLRASWELLKSKGKLLYVTCSIFEIENRLVIDRFLNDEKTANEIKIKFPKNVNVDDNQLLPSLFHDGLFYALLQKK
jgi:16S rRNA (cytosine967-C5)-methyltransferase